MSSDSASGDSSSPHNATIDLLIQILMEHEQEMTKLIGRLEEVKTKLNNKKKLYRRFEEIEVKLCNFESEIKHLSSNLSISK
jgi:uncharacterized coiled-coil protein SlyX